MSETPRPYFWIRRNGSTYVPLIPVDELPSSVGIRGVSITKNWNDVCQGEMRFLGDHDVHSGGHFVVDLFRSADEGSSESDSSSSTPTEKALTDSDKKADEVKTEEVKTGADQVKANTAKLTSDSDGGPDQGQSSSQQDGLKYQGTAGTLGKKVYCTYWIRTGNCNYMQEGCKYKHEIPPDDETRLAIGVRTYPTWPREDPVCNPRPPPVKPSPLQKPAAQQTWRRAATVPTKAEKAGSQKNSHRGKPRKSSDPNPGANAHRSTQIKSTPISASDSSSSKEPINHHPHATPVISATNAAQHFPSRAQASTPAPASSNNHQQPAIADTAGLSNGRAAAPALLLRNPLPPKPVSGGQKPSPFVQSTQTPMAAPQNHSNPFAQRLPSNQNHVAAGAPSPFSSPYNPTFSTGTPTATDYYPSSKVFDSGSNFPGFAAVTAAAVENRLPVGEVFYNRHPGRHSLVTNQYGPDSSVQDTNNNSGRASSHANTPGSSNDTARAAFSNVTTDSSTTASANSGSRAATPLMTQGKQSGFSSNNAFGIFNPPAIDTRTPTPLSIKGHGPVLFNPNKGKFSPAAIQKPTFSNGHKSVTNSPPPIHRRMFRAPGEAEFVENPLEEAHSKSHRTIKKHVTGQSGTKVKKTGTSKHSSKSQQDLLV